MAAMIGGTFVHDAESTFTTAGSVYHDTGTVTFNNAISVAGELEVRNSATMVLNGTQSFPAVKLNGGTMLWVDNSIDLNRGGSGRIENAAGAVWEARFASNSYSINATNFGDISSAPLPSFTNAGIVRKTTGAVTWTNSIPFVNSGIVQSETGSVAFDSSFTQTAGTLLLQGGGVSNGNALLLQGGTIEGAGTISGSVNNTGGTVAPGTSSDSSATLAITGSYTQAAAGALAVDLGGTEAGTFDVLSVGGGATLDGTFRVALVDSFTPANNNTFNVLTFASRSGDFPTNEGLTQGTTTFAKSYSATVLTLTSSSSVPQSRPGLDLDSDGLFDAWEQKNFGSLAATSEEDMDGDGEDNLSEFKSATDPNDAASVKRTARVLGLRPDWR